MTNLMQGPSIYFVDTYLRILACFAASFSGIILIETHLVFFIIFTCHSDLGILVWQEDVTPTLCYDTLLAQYGVAIYNPSAEHSCYERGTPFLAAG
jgi:hypothetical protein